MVKILLISHDASRTGAPILLLNLANSLKEQQGVSVTFWVKKSGPILSQFESIAPTFCIESLLWLKGPMDLKGRLRKWRNEGRLRGQLHEFDVVISNTITNGDLHFLLKDHGCVVTYVHELSGVIASCTTPQDLDFVKQHTKRFLYPSLAVRDNLLKNERIKQANLERLDYYIPDKKREAISMRDEVRRELGCSQEDIMICGMGTSDMRKGTDLFWRACELMCKNYPNAKFVWVGSRSGQPMHETIQKEAIEAGLSSNFSLVAPTDFPSKYLGAADIFFLSSREDPYPLVMIEAAMMGLPIVYFSGSGGADEFVGNSLGIGAEGFDPKNAAAALGFLAENPKERELLGDSANEAYQNGHGSKHVREQLFTLSLKGLIEDL